DPAGAPPGGVAAGSGGGGARAIGARGDGRERTWGGGRGRGRSDGRGRGRRDGHGEGDGVASRFSRGVDGSGAMDGSGGTNQHLGGDGSPAVERCPWAGGGPGRQGADRRPA